MDPRIQRITPITKSMPPMVTSTGIPVTNPTTEAPLREQSPEFSLLLGGRPFCMNSQRKTFNEQRHYGYAGTDDGRGTDQRIDTKRLTLMSGSLCRPAAQRHDR